MPNTNRGRRFYEDVNAYFAAGARSTSLPAGILRQLEACNAVYRMTFPVVGDDGEVQVLEAEVAYMSEGRQATVAFAAFPGETFTGRVVSINPRVDPATRTARVTLHLSNADHRIKPGMYARVSLDAQSFAGRILVPRSALLERDRRPMLFVYNGDEEGGRAEWRYVCRGLESDAIVEILSPCDEGEVAPGDVVLVDGHHYLVHDAPVRLVDDPASAGGRPGR